jgi:two-component system sensor histidine kinase KdpD
MAVERSELATRARAAQLSAETERAKSALLSSLSHDFRTPLAAIVGAGNSLVEFGNRLDPIERTELAHGIVEEGERLHRLLTNVLALTRLEGGGPKVKRTPYALEEVVDSAVRRLGTRIDSRQITVDAPLDTPMASLEPMLTEQLLINVLENAVRYSPSGSPIDVKLRWTESEISVSIADRGPGVPPEDESRIFEKFYRSVSADHRDGGMGLGLAICRAIAQAQDGRVEARNRSGGGLEVTFSVARAGEPETADLPAPLSDTTAGETPQC